MNVDITCMSFRLYLQYTASCVVSTSIICAMPETVITVILVVYRKYIRKSWWGFIRSNIALSKWGTMKESVGVSRGNLFSNSTVQSYGHTMHSYLTAALVTRRTTRSSHSPERLAGRQSTPLEQTTIVYVIKILGDLWLACMGPGGTSPTHAITNGA